MILTETEEVPVLCPCTSGVAQRNGAELYYECFGDSSNPAVLLVTGMAVQCIYWPLEMCQAIVDAGYYLIRLTIGIRESLRTQMVRRKVS
ncbi:MAG: hypothetical protein JKY56_07495 [Kofleriaceae bacterium]|nr:hypothetical protein [Kofleriaceae bacterium]